MKKINAWTMVELVIALTILILLSTLCITVYKPNIQKAKIVIYATIKNLTQGNIAIMEANDNTLVEDNVVDGSNVYDWHCLRLADVFSLENNADCKVDSEKKKNLKVNLTFPTGVTVQGLTNDWLEPFDGSEYKIKNIVVDIDGRSGVNKIGVDRFPLRLYDGSGFTGMIQVVNCKSDKDVVYNDDTKVTLGGDFRPYCKQGFEANGNASNVVFDLDNKIISYDIYRATSSEEEATAELVASSLAPMDADCGAYGGEGFYHKKQCEDSSNKINGDYLRIRTKCATSTNCAECGNICPRNKDDNSNTDESSCTTMAASLNPEDLPCFTLLHKPSGGTTFLLETLIGQFDM